MKNKLFLLAFLAIAMASCQKDDNTSISSASSPGNSAIRTGPNTIGPVPATFTQKLMLENITGTPYGRCPANDLAITQFQATYPDRVIPASFHMGDRMETTATSSLLNFVSNGTVPQIPAVMLNRIVFTGKMINDQGNWMTNVPYALSGSPDCGLAIQSTAQSNVLNMNVHVGFNTTVAGNYKLCVYLIEDKIHQTGLGYDQANSYNLIPTSPFYNMGNPILNYTHNSVVRNLVTTLSGITVPTSYQVTGGHMIQPFSIDLRGLLNQGNTYIVAYIYNTATLQVMNSQMAKIGTVKSWD